LHTTRNSLSIIEELRNIKYRLDDIEKLLVKVQDVKIEIKDADVLNIIDHLRKTYLVVVSKKECTALDVSLITGRCRAIESSYLNQLRNMGKLKKYRVSKTVMFKVA
jgi:hypothetical protein